MSVSDYRYGKHAAAIAEAEARKSQLFPSARTAAVVAVAAISQIFAAPQADPSQLQAQLFRPLIGARATSSPVLFGSPQPDPTQIASSVWSSVRRPPTSPLAGPTVFIAPPQADPTQTAAVLFRPLRGAPATSSPVLFGSPQPDPTQIAASVWSSVRRPPTSPLAGPTVFIAPPQADPTQRDAVLFRPLIGAKPQSSLVVFGTPQTDPSQLPALLTPTARGPILGTTVRPIPPVPPQFDISVNGSVIWTQLPMVGAVAVTSSRERTKMGVGT